MQLTAGNFEEEVLKSKLPVIVDFWASWCGPCRMMAPVFEQMSKEYEGKLKFAKVSTEEFPEIAEENQVSGIPCLIIFHRGKEVDRIVGFSPKDELKESINEIMEKI